VPVLTLQNHNAKRKNAMAILRETKNNASRILSDELAPKGTFIAVCIDVEDAFGVQRPKFDDPTQMETVDLTWFYFGYFAKGGKRTVIKSKPFKLSLHEKSALFQFLKSWKGEAPKAGLDTETLRGHGAQITVDHGVSAKGRTFANIISISPLIEGLEKNVPAVAEFAALLEPQDSGTDDNQDEDKIPF
jgi:hypothetical protein